MDAFLIPVGDSEYELYCEADPDTAEEDETLGPPTLWQRAVRIFKRMLAEGEAERRRGATEPPPERSRLRRWVARHLASAVAEQRLLWYLRKESDAALVHADDLSAPDAIRHASKLLSHDASRHFKWCVIDTLLAIASIPVALVPGPNVLGYYFLFRAVGHFFSVRGARHGITGVTWHGRPSPSLTALRAALREPAAERSRRIDAIADALGLERLAAFIEDAAKTPAD